MIPKTIHYCWFGRKEMPQEFQKYIFGWKNLHPNFEIILWNEDNIPQNIPYVNTALENKKYANASNYIRLWAIYHYGGIYLDTDFEIFERLNSCMNVHCFFGKEPAVSGEFYVNNAIIGAIPKHWFIEKCLVEISYKYDGKEFANFSSPVVTTYLLSKYGKIDNGEAQMILDVYLHGVKAFYPYNYLELNKSIRPAGNIGIHHFAYSWKPPKSKVRNIKKFVVKLVPNQIKTLLKYGYSNYKIINNKTIIDGPFKGLKYQTQKVNGSAIFPKIFGSYEECLHMSLYKFQLKKYEKVYNLGGGEGYYTIGLHHFFKPQIQTIVYEADKSNVAYLSQNIIANNIEGQILVKNEFANEHTLLEIGIGENSFIFCDIEGDESIVFNSTVLENIKNCDLIIEIHDFINYNIFSSLIELFKPTHNIEVIKEDRNNIIKNKHLMSTKRSYWQYDLINERRPEAMRWLVLESKNQEPVFLAKQ